MNFEWDELKNKSNIKKHGISFKAACEIFLGELLTWEDTRKSYGEIREISIGEISSGLILVVVHTRRGNKVRIISARKALPTERSKYYDYIY